MGRVARRRPSPPAADAVTLINVQAAYLQLRYSQTREQPSVKDIRSVLPGELSVSPEKELLPQEYKFNLLLYRDPAGGGRVWLQIRGDRWDGSTFPFDFFFQDPRVGLRPDPNAGAFGTLTIGRRIAYMLGYAAWAMLFVGLVITWRQMSHAARLNRAVTLMEIAAVSTVLAMAGPLGWDRWSDFFQDDAPGLGYLALIASAGIMVIAVRQARPDGVPRCRALRVRPHRQRKRRMPRVRPVGGDATYSVIVVKATSCGRGMLRQTSSANCTRRRGCGASTRRCLR